MHFRPPLGEGLALLLVTAATVSMIWFNLVRHGKDAWRRLLPLALLRLGALASLAWIIAGPSVQDGPDHADRATRVLLLADTSASMAQRDVLNLQPAARPFDPVDRQPSSRWGAIVRRWLNRPFLDRLRGHRLDVQLYGFDRRLVAMGIDEARDLDEPTGDRTDLFGALGAAMSLVQGDGADNRRLGSSLIVLLSDGHDSQAGADPALLARLQQAQIPVITVPVGVAGDGADISVAAWTEADFLFANQSTWIEAAVAQRGFNQRRARIELFHEERLIEYQTIDFGDQPIVRVRFRVTPPTGSGQGVSLHAYRVAARLVSNPGSDEPEAVVASESFVDNNSRWVFVELSSDRIKVALFEGQPYWDTKFLARVLKDDSQVDLTALYRLGPNRSVNHRSSPGQGRLIEQGQSASHALDRIGMPESQSLTQAWLNQFDVVILGRGSELFFGGDRAGILVDYVTQRGGALVLARGSAFDDATAAGRQAGQILADIEPVRWGRAVLRDLKLSLAPAGRTSPLTRFEHLDRTDAILTQMPDMLAATEIEGEKAASIVLLRQSPLARQQPLSHDRMAVDHAMAAVAYQNVGRGRVFAVLGDGLWRWAFLPSSLSEYDSVYELFWARAIRWLATGGAFLPGQSVSMSQSKLAVEPGEPVTVTVTARGVGPQAFAGRLDVIAPDGQIQQIALVPMPGASLRYQATVQPDQSGVYALHLIYGLNGQGQRGAVASPVTSRLAVYDQSTERLDTSARPDLLAWISQATGGQCLSAEQPEQLLQYVRDLRQARQSHRRDRYVFDRPVAFALIVGLFGLEWFFRRRRGLL